MLLLAWVLLRVALNAIYQLIPGHEVVGVVETWGKNVTGFARGDRCVADPGVTVSACEALSCP